MAGACSGILFADAFPCHLAACAGAVARVFSAIDKLVRWLFAFLLDTSTAGCRSCGRGVRHINGDVVAARSLCIFKALLWLARSYVISSAVLRSPLTIRAGGGSPVANLTACDCIGQFTSIEEAQMCCNAAKARF
ncbi:hypothetical protein B0A48_08647 [Cryoendolithus antarcticus]|uniref:Uncharacterized protein n=1 Tax=Cryoendolithus antarcticus TaxID=1507870 RepID=A0A1V8T408_9PEZI|nr:hypothetical protein B0A48_08647 [Cryoendolithus antarcticus]